LSIGASGYYTPDAWMPHITLPHGDVTPTRLRCAIDKLACQDFDWEIRVDNLALVYQEDEKQGQLKYRMPFVG